MLSRDQERFVKAQLEHLMREMALARTVRLVGGHEHATSRLTQHQGDLTVDWRQTLPNIEEQHDCVRLLDGNFGLSAHRRLRLVVIPNTGKPRCVHHREFASVPGGDSVEAVARQSGLWIHDRLAPTDDAVEKRGLPHVWPPDDGHDRSRHLTISTGFPAPASQPPVFGETIDRNSTDLTLESAN